MKHKLESKLPWEHNIRFANDVTLMVESEEELEPLDEGERDGKSWLKLNIQKTKIMAYSPII